METHIESQFASNCHESMKVLSNRLDLTRIERLVTVDVNPSYRKSIGKTLKKYSPSSYEGRMEMLSNRRKIVAVSFLKTTEGSCCHFLFSTTHYHTLLTPLYFRYVNAQFDFRYTMLLIFTHCLPPSTSGMLTHDSTSGVKIRQRP